MSKLSYESNFDNPHQILTFLYSIYVFSHIFFLFLSLFISCNICSVPHEHKIIKTQDGQLTESSHCQVLNIGNLRFTTQKCQNDPLDPPYQTP